MFVSRFFLVLFGSVLNNFALQYVKPVHFGVGFPATLRSLSAILLREQQVAWKISWNLVKSIQVNLFLVDFNRLESLCFLRSAAAVGV